MTGMATTSEIANGSAGDRNAQIKIPKKYCAVKIFKASPNTVSTGTKKSAA